MILKKLLRLKSSVQDQNGPGAILFRDLHIFQGCANTDKEPRKQPTVAMNLKIDIRWSKRR